MSTSSDIQQVLAEAVALFASGNFAAAEQALQALLERSTDREPVLAALLDLYLQGKRPLEAIETLKLLRQEVPHSLFYCNRLAGLYEGLGQLGTAILEYRQFLQAQPGNANAWFNLALLYKKGKRFAEARRAYERCIALGGDGLEEVYSNMGVLFAEMRDTQRARQMYQRSLEVKPDYIPTLFNLAGLNEEAGRREAASELYTRILEIDPGHNESLARLAYAKKISPDDTDIIGALQQASARQDGDTLGRESVFFALGKAFDDLEDYAEAFAAYTRANALGKLRNPSYHRPSVEQAFADLKSAFSADWIRRASGAATVSPVFICGMFRSGSTLLEQILAGHADITPGGELDYLQWLVAQKLAPFPRRVLDSPAQHLQAVGQEYLALVKALFPAAKYVTDKQPDNFLYLGLIKILFPAAKIIYTRRNPPDNALSIYFQQLGGHLSYATSLEDTAHYYRQHRDLMRHWSDCFAENIFTVDYDALVSKPEPLLRNLLGFLELEWDPACLAFQHSANAVKTASVWQVREELHTRSSGRWRHYLPYAGDLEALLR